MDTELKFAAEVTRAQHDAATARKHGIPSTASDVVAGALCDLWQCSPFRRQETQRIADKYVRYDANDNPWPRNDIDLSNVTLFPT